MTQESRFKLAALASALMPEMQFAGARQSEQANVTDINAGISHAVVQSITGQLFDVFASTDKKGRQRLHDRARAAWALEQTKGLAALGFTHDTLVKFDSGEDTSKREDESDVRHYSQPTVLIGNHLEGSARELRLLTTEDCANVGTALGAIHRLNPTFLHRSHYPVFTTGQIRAQLIAWIQRLRKAGHVPQEITDSWSRILETDGLWSFETCPVHGGFADGDILFIGSTITAITNWQSMQVNDPARDLAWIFAKLNDQHRDALIEAYGRILGSRLDSMIMLRANLWLQMEQVGDFIQALSRADNTGIMKFKAQVEHLAHQLSRINNTQKPAQQPSSMTVSSLLNDDTNATHAQEQQLNSDERDITLSGTVASLDTTADNITRANDTTNEHPIATSATMSQVAHTTTNVDVTPTNTTNVLNESSDDTNESDEIATQVISSIHNNQQTQTPEQTPEQSPATIVIPLLEREDVAMRNAHVNTNSTGNTDDTGIASAQ